MIDLPPVLYAREQSVGVAEFRRVLVESGLGATRPVDDEERLKAMLSGADLIVTAQLAVPERPLVGIAHCVTDFSWICYLSELVVSASAQRLGVGRGLLEGTRRELGPTVALVLASMPDVVGFYERVGMARVADVFWYKRER